MTIPDEITANIIPTGNGEPRGIIYKIRSLVTNTKILEYVFPTTNADRYGDYKTFVKWDSFWHSDFKQDAYIQVEFKDRYVFPTHYSLKGALGRYHSKNWNLFGFNKIGEAMTLLSSDTCVGSTYCGDPAKSSPDIYCCQSDDWGTFKIKNAKKSFRYFRFVSTEPTRAGKWLMIAVGFDIFGVLSKGIRKTIKANIRISKIFYFRLLMVFLS